MMKKLVALSPVAAIAASATIVFAGMPAATGVNGSLHDMDFYAPTKGGAPEKYDRVCVYCHTPHNAVVNDPNDPLGVNFLPSGTTTSLLYLHGVQLGDPGQHSVHHC